MPLRAAEGEWNVRPLVLAGILLGIGLGGFLDGLALHQILQLHHMMSARLPPTTLVNVEANMLWDGLFHAFTWLVTLAGVIALHRAGRGADRFWSGHALAGAMLMGWGLFNLVEGAIDHHILHLHHVVESLGVSVYDWLFLASGPALMVGGWWMIRRGVRAGEAPAPRPARAAPASSA